MKFFWLLLLPGFWLSAQDHGSIDNKPQGGNNMQTAPETVPKEFFPFGQPLKLVKQEDRSPKEVFVLGVYASAVHAKWYPPEGKPVEALAVASEPEIFWNGGNADKIIKQIDVPSEAGRLEPADEKYNGPSGRTLDELYLKPLGLSLSRDNVWLCDLVPRSFMNNKQKKAIKNRYTPLCEKHDLPEASIRERPPNLIKEDRRNEILAELEESQAKTIILLGDDPIKWFLSHVSERKETRLAEFGRRTYGDPISVTINDKEYTVIPLVHVRQAGGLGPHNPYWRWRHSKWVEKMNKRQLSES